MSFKLILNHTDDGFDDGFWKKFNKLFEPNDGLVGKTFPKSFQPEIRDWIHETDMIEPLARWEGIGIGLVITFATEQDRLLFKLRWL